MKSSVENTASRLRALPAAALAGLLCLAAVSSCGGDGDKAYIPNTDPETTPSMTTVDVSTLISDSGVMRYKITAPVWYVFDHSTNPRWTFPQTLHLEQFDDFFNKDATIDCDSATYFSSKQLWRLDGHVRVVNLAGERFLTQQLFWDQKQQKVYSDSFVQVFRSDRVVEGHGFVSNETMTKFQVTDVSAILPVQQFTGVGAADSVAAASPADSASTSPRRSPRPRSSARTQRTQQQ